jgi:hypothetical protein
MLPDLNIREEGVAPATLLARRHLLTLSPEVPMRRALLASPPTLESRVSTLSQCILFLGLAGCQEPSAPDLASGGPSFAPAQAATIVEVFPDEFTETLFCTNEEVTWTGRVLLVIHTTNNRGFPPTPDLFQHLIEVNAVHYTGIGLTSGDRYRYNAVLNHSLQAPDPVDPFPATETLAVRERIIGPGGFIGFATFTIRFVVSGSGEVVIERVEMDTQCR